MCFVNDFEAINRQGLVKICEEFEVRGTLLKWLQYLKNLYQKSK